jgi:hypothetical protein
MHPIVFQGSRVIAGLGVEITSTITRHLAQMAAASRRL